MRGSSGRAGGPVATAGFGGAPTAVGWLRGGAAGGGFPTTPSAQARDRGPNGVSPSAAARAIGTATAANRAVNHFMRPLLGTAKEDRTRRNARRLEAIT